MHGGFLLAFVLVLPGLIQLIPLAALAAILVYTGYQLTSPRVFYNIAQHGIEQLLVFCVTILATLVEGIMTGIFAGDGLQPRPAPGQVGHVSAREPAGHGQGPPSMSCTSGTRATMSAPMG